MGTDSEFIARRNLDSVIWLRVITETFMFLYSHIFLKHDENRMEPQCMYDMKFVAFIPTQWHDVHFGIMSPLVDKEK